MKNEYLYLNKKTGFSCNLCDRGIINLKTGKVEYPYQSIYELTSDQSKISIRFCDDCLDILSELISK